VSLLAGLDLHSGRVIETVSDTHKSADFIAFLKKLEDAYPAPQRIRLILDNHSAHISKETRSYLDTIPQRFVFVFTPTHGSWLNLIEN
jgi:transposase